MRIRSRRKLRRSENLQWSRDIFAIKFILGSGFRTRHAKALIDRIENCECAMVTNATVYLISTFRLTLTLTRPEAFFSNVYTIDFEKRPIECEEFQIKHESGFDVYLSQFNTLYVFFFVLIYNFHCRSKIHHNTISIEYLSFFLNKKIIS